MKIKCTCGWLGKRTELDHRGQCPDCGDWDRPQARIPEDDEDAAMLKRIEEGHEIMSNAIVTSGANAICWANP